MTGRDTLAALPLRGRGNKPLKKIKTTVSFMSAICLTAILFAGNVSGQILQVSSVSVDTCWNSDSSWYDNNGILQQRTSRDCRISFTPMGEGTARMFISMSIDSGKTWAQSPNPLIVMNNALASTFITGQKATITVRVLGGDRPGTVFKMTARQAAPVIAGPKSVIQGLTTVLTPGQSVGAFHWDCALRTRHQPTGFARSQKCIGTRSATGR